MPLPLPDSLSQGTGLCDAILASLFWETCLGTSPGLCTHLAEVMEPSGIDNSVLPDLALLVLSSVRKRLPVCGVEIILDGVLSTQHCIVRVEN